MLMVILIVQYAGTWYGLELIRISKEEDLEQHLEELASVLEPELRQLGLRLSDLEFESLWVSRQRTSGTSEPDASYYEQQADPVWVETLLDMTRRSRLDRLLILGQTGQVLLDSAYPQRYLENYDYQNIDQLELERAREGKSLGTPPDASDETLQKRYYLPIREDDGQVKGVAVLVAGREYTEAMLPLQRGIMVVTALVTALLVVIALIIFRLESRQRKMLAHVMEADRLSGLGTLAAGFAHELRNPLEIIRAYTEDLERSLREDIIDIELAREACHDVVEEIERMNRLVSQFLGYTRGEEQSEGERQTSVVETLRAVLTILQVTAAKKQVALTVEPPQWETLGARWAVAIDSGGWKQVLMNLLLNALEVAPPGSAITMHLEIRRRELVMTIADQGPGIPPETAKRIFEPFFSTRPAGSGMGLAVSRQIVERVGGGLRLVPTAGGACFEIRLPRADDLDPGSNHKTPPRALSQHGQLSHHSDNGER